jgi:hypothetical protein
MAFTQAPAAQKPTTDAVAVGAAGVAPQEREALVLSECFRLLTSLDRPLRRRRHGDAGVAAHKRKAAALRADLADFFYERSEGGRA